MTRQHDPCVMCSKFSIVGRCEWCGSHATDLRPRRDYDEGMSGRVYDVCGACVRRESERAQEELEELGYYDNNYDYD